MKRRADVLLDDDYVAFSQRPTEAVAASSIAEPTPMPELPTPAGEVLLDDDYVAFSQRPTAAVAASLIAEPTPMPLDDDYIAFSQLPTPAVEVHPPTQQQQQQPGVSGSVARGDPIGPTGSRTTGGIAAPYRLPLPVHADIGSQVHVERMLGSGAFGAVFLGTTARDPRRRVAIKVFKAMPALRGRLDNEIEMAALRRARVSQNADGCLSNVACFVSGFVWAPPARGAGNGDGGVGALNALANAYYDHAFGGSFVRGKRYPVIVTEYVPGDDLSKHVYATPPLSAAQLRQVARSAARGLSQLHARGITHRDIKPDNIRVRTLADGTLDAVLIDLGLACAEDAPRGADLYCNPRPAGVVGTTMYLSPQLAYAALHRAYVGEATRKANDVWALGLSLYRLARRDAMPHGLPTRGSAKQLLRALAALAASRGALGADERGARLVPGDPVLGIVIADMLDVDEHARPSADDVLNVLDRD